MNGSLSKSTTTGKVYVEIYKKYTNQRTYSPVKLTWNRIKPFSNDRLLDITKLKISADNKINEAQIMISVFDRVENIVRKGGNAGYQHFLLFPQCVQKRFFLWAVKSRDSVVAL